MLRNCEQKCSGCNDYPLYNIFRVFYFRGLCKPRKYFDNENFQTYGSYFGRDGSIIYVSTYNSNSLRGKAHHCCLLMSTCLAALQYHQRWRSQRLSRELWWETPPPSPALSPEATPWATTPTHGCTTTPWFLVKLEAYWMSVSWQNPTLVSTAVRWPTLLDWVAVTLLPLNLEVSVGYSTNFSWCKALEREKENPQKSSWKSNPGPSSY